RRGVRDELPAHARAALAARLPVRPGPDARARRDAVRDLPPAPLAVTRLPGHAVAPDPSAAPPSTRSFDGSPDVRAVPAIEDPCTCRTGGARWASRRSAADLGRGRPGDAA